MMALHSFNFPHQLVRRYRRCIQCGKRMVTEERERKKPLGGLASDAYLAKRILGGPKGRA